MFFSPKIKPMWCWRKLLLFCNGFFLLFHSLTSTMSNSCINEFEEKEEARKSEIKSWSYSHHSFALFPFKMETNPGICIISYSFNSNNYITRMSCIYLWFLRLLNIFRNQFVKYYYLLWCVDWRFVVVNMIGQSQKKYLLLLFTYMN